MSGTASAYDPQDPQSGPPRDHLLADSEAPWTYQQTDQDDLNPRLDSHASSTSNLCFPQNGVYFEGRTIAPTVIEARQQSQRSDSISDGIKSPLRTGEQEIPSPNSGAPLNSQETI
jgi:hypothetical protein